MEGLDLNARLDRAGNLLGEPGLVAHMVDIFDGRREVQQGVRLAEQLARRAAPLNLNIGPVVEPVLGPVAAQAVDAGAVGGGIGAAIAWAAAQIPALAAYAPAVGPAGVATATGVALASLGVRYVYNQAQTQAAIAYDVNRNQTLQAEMMRQRTLKTYAAPIGPLDKTTTFNLGYGRAIRVPFAYQRQTYDTPIGPTPLGLLRAPPPPTMFYDVDMGTSPVPREEGPLSFLQPPQDLGQSPAPRWEGPPSFMQPIPDTGTSPAPRWEGPPDRDPGDPGGDPDPEPQSGGFHKKKRPRFTGRGFRLGETPLIPGAGFTPWDKEVAFKVPDRGFTPYESTFYPVFRGNRARTGTQVRAEPVPASQALVTADYFQQYNLQQLAGDASLASDTKPVSARVEMEAAPRATPTVVNYVAPAGAASLRTAAGGGADGGGDLPPQFDCAMCSREAFLMGAALSYAF